MQKSAEPGVLVRSVTQYVGQQPDDHGNTGDARPEACCHSVLHKTADLLRDRQPSSRERASKPRLACSASTRYTQSLTIAWVLASASLGNAVFNAANKKPGS